MRDPFRSLTRANLAGNADAVADHLRIGPEQRLLAVLPTLHVFGLTVLNFVPLVRGAAASPCPAKPATSSGIVPVRGSVVTFVSAADGSEPNAAELRAFCREHLAGFKVPREVRVCASLPTGPTGKALKRQLLAGLR